MADAPNIPKLTRAIQEMPAFVEDALEGRRLMVVYRSRRPYQQNDDLSWTNRAKLAATKEKHLLQMLDELERGDRSMKMPYRAKEG